MPTTATDREGPVSSTAAAKPTLPAPRRARASAAAIIALASVGLCSIAPTEADATTRDAASALTCRMIAVSAEHGGPIAGRSRLSRIVHGRVLSMNPNTGRTSMVRFTKRSGRWLESASGAHYAVSGQAISRDGRAGGGYVIAAQLAGHRSVPCAKPSGLQALAADTASAEAAGTNLTSSAVEETPGSTRNRARLLENYSTQKLCLTTPTHPDGAPQISHPSSGVWCYRGRGAWLNDPRGTEWRMPEAPFAGGYFIDTEHTHVILYNNAVVPAAKRPATKPNGEMIVNSPIAWRPYAPNLRFPAGY